MNTLKILQYLPIVMQLIDSVETVKKNPNLKFRQTDALLYAACRLLAVRLEERNERIWETTGFADPIEPSQN